MSIIDAHVHLWLQQQGSLNGRPVLSLTGGKSDFGGEVRQMMPPYMLTGANTAEMLLANMDYAGVWGAVATQEIIDGDQNGYLLSVREKYPERFRITAYYNDGCKLETAGFDGIKLCACRLKDPDLTHCAHVFETAEKNDLFVAVELADGDAQTGALLEMARQYPGCRIVIGHFGMVTRPGWQEQIRLAREKNVFIESGGITWLFHKEFYPYPGAVRAVREAAEICGFEKLMWGSDYPRTMTEITYKMSFDFIEKTDALTPEQKRLFLCENARRFFRFGAPEELPKVKNMLED